MKQNFGAHKELQITGGIKGNEKMLPEPTMIKEVQLYNRDNKQQRAQKRPKYYISSLFQSSLKKVIVTNTYQNEFKQKNKEADHSRERTVRNACLN